jgi:branched-chain amino acid aminotransferase
MSGYDEAIVLSENGHVSEGSAMNLFMVKRGILITTPITENILEGITRATVMEFAKNEFGFETVSRSIDRSELYTADELFFCGTGAQIAPIIEIDKRTLSNGQPGPITAKIKDMYQKICHGNAKQYSKWLTPVYAKDKAAVSSSK